ncbi:hypothetical protein L596_021110 [Steinernema carpocapsae]|uniref:Uncharacterized protein n=1 Tax=Steinernema carpocapsae TaxID=34508 RepID=A0A4U5MWG9_STECR|nr:hypothetical protein L596_021110 [Steinernema carpocapsae]
MLPTDLIHFRPFSSKLRPFHPNGGVPCKRPAMDKNGASTQAAAVNAANLAIYSQQQQFNPYLMPSLHGYVPAVSFSGQLPPPRY